MTDIKDYSKQPNETRANIELNSASTRMESAQSLQEKDNSDESNNSGTGAIIDSSENHLNPDKATASSQTIKLTASSVS
jgi:hypothetical protein